MSDQTDRGIDAEVLLERTQRGDRQAAVELLPRYRDRLRRMIELRLDSRLHRRLDASDVVQDALVDIASRLDDYLKDPKLPFFLWMRLIAGDRLLRLHRQHLGSKMRDIGREVSLYRSALPAASSFALASMLLGPPILTDPGRGPRRTATEDPGRAQRARTDRPRGPGPAALRAALAHRDRAGARPEAGRRVEAVHPRAEAAETGTREHARWAGGPLR